jgi:hypothetical protein
MSYSTLKPFRSFLLRIVAFAFVSCFLINTTNGKTGFSLPDSVGEFTIKYTTIEGLIILPVRINDSITVNLILDTGCRNVLLFGKRFQKLFKVEPGRTVEFSGMGSGKTVTGQLALNNTAAIGAVEGENVPIVLIADRNIFNTYWNIDGLIGYDIFTKFEIEIQPSQRLITFRSAFNNYLPEGYQKIPIRVVDAKPVINSSILLPNETLAWDLLIDTGSTLGLLLKSTDKSRFPQEDSKEWIGKGLNGSIKGINTVASKVKLHEFELTNISTGIVHSPWHNYASIGMNVLKEYSIILNYAMSFAALKKNG